MSVLAQELKCRLPVSRSAVGRKADVIRRKADLQALVLQSGGAYAGTGRLARNTIFASSIAIRSDAATPVVTSQSLKVSGTV